MCLGFLRATLGTRKIVKFSSLTRHNCQIIFLSSLHLYTSPLSWNHIVMIVEHARSSCRLFCARLELRRQSNNRQAEFYVFFPSSCWIAASSLDCRQGKKTERGKESCSTATRRRWYDGVSGKIHTEEKKGRKSTPRRSSHSSWVKLKFIYSRYLAKLVVAAHWE